MNVEEKTQSCVSPFQLLFILSSISIVHLLSLLKGLVVGAEFAYVFNYPHLSGWISKSGSLINKYLRLCSKAACATGLHQTVNARSIMCSVCVLQHTHVMHTLVYLLIIISDIIYHHF